MRIALGDWAIQKISKWFTKETEPKRSYMSSYVGISHNIRPSDVLLFEGRRRISNIIKQITRSPWSHAALYIGRIQEIDDPTLVAKIKEHFDGPDDEQLVIESELGQGVIITPLSFYKDEHIRISRPSSISVLDAKKVIEYAIGQLGGHYSIRHILDLLRFLFPWAIFPRRWRSSLFSHNALKPTEDICSSMIAQAFMSVDYPILPRVEYDSKTGYELTRRNPKLFTPSDFDYSPYFEIIKYPIFGNSKKMAYKDLQWKKGEISHD